MLFMLSTPMLIRHLWKLKTVIFLHWCLIHALLLTKTFLRVGKTETKMVSMCIFQTERGEREREKWKVNRNTSKG
jgi:hypothetical protein